MPPGIAKPLNVKPRTARRGIEGSVARAEKEDDAIGGDAAPGQRFVRNAACLKQVALLDKGHDQDRPGNTAIIIESGGRQGAVGVMVAVKSQTDLLEVIGALGPVGRLPDLLDGRQKQPDQDRDGRHSGRTKPVVSCHHGFRRAYGSFVLYQATKFSP